MNSDDDNDIPAWKTAIDRWRALPAEERHRRRWERIPRNVAESMAFEGEPVDLAWLEEEHAKHPMPPLRSARAGNLVANASADAADVPIPVCACRGGPAKGNPR